MMVVIAVCCLAAGVLLGNGILPKDIIDFLNTYYDCSYKTGTRETIRKEAITELLDKNLIESNDRPKQSPYYGYRIKIEIGGKRK